MRCSLLVAAACGLLISVVSPSAHALGPVDVEAAAIGGYGTNSLNAELGGRAGVSIFGIYAGVRGEYFTGTTSPATEVLHADTYHQYALGGEVGYGFKIGLVPGTDLVIRPLVGFGYANYSDRIQYPAAPSPPPNGLVTYHYSQPYFQPGVLVQLGLGPLLVGVEGSAFAPTTEASQSGFVIEGQLGLRF